MEPWVRFPEPLKSDVMLHACTSRTKQLEARGSGVPDSDASLGYMRSRFQIYKQWINKNYPYTEAKKKFPGLMEKVVQGDKRKRTKEIKFS